MAMMFNCATDWTFDEFMQDSKLYKATPTKGVHCRRGASYNEEFMTWFKNLARDFKESWLQSHQFEYDDRDGWIGDAFAKILGDACFSDYYKDTYGQRPHLDKWFYIQAVKLPMSQDVARTFCARPVEDAIENARRMKEF